MLAPPIIPDHTLLRLIGRGSYGEVWLARNIMGVLRAVKIVSPMEDTPAWRAGLKPGDYITHINGELVYGLSLDDIRNLRQWDSLTPAHPEHGRFGQVGPVLAGMPAVEGDIAVRDASATDVDAVLAILPAGTANLLANNLDIPTDLKAAVEIGLRGERHAFDTGTINGEHFAVMGGAAITLMLTIGR